MTTKELVKLPKINEEGFYEIRMESIGGMGANLAGKMLGEALMLEMRYNGCNFASYGSEKKGTPVKSYIRVCDPDKEVWVNGPVTKPHLLAIFHEKILKTYNVTHGIYEDSVIVLNSKEAPDKARDMLEVDSGKICTIDAIKIAIEEKVKINTVILGAICKASGFIDRGSVEAIIKKTLGKRYPHLVESNIKAFERGFNELKEKEFKKEGKYQSAASKVAVQELGFKNAPMGGVILDIGNSITKDNSASREGFIPIYHKDKCVLCGECEMVCPEFCFYWVKGKDNKGKEGMILEGIDYQYCKGCLKCIQSCRFEALTKGIEVEHDVEAMTVKKKFK